MAQQVKNLPAVQETQGTQIRSLREDSLEKEMAKEMATHSSILDWRIPMDRGAWWATVHEVTESQIRLSNLSSTERHRLPDTQ